MTVKWTFYCVASDMVLFFFEQRHTTTVELTSHFIQQLLPLIKRNCFTDSPLNFPVPQQKNLNIIQSNA